MKIVISDAKLGRKERLVVRKNIGYVISIKSVLQQDSCHFATTPTKEKTCQLFAGGQMSSF